MTDWRTTACILCECNCGVEVQLDGRRLLRFRGDKAHPISRGYACEKPHRLDHYQNGPSRLTSPLRRTAAGDFEEIDWDTAIREVAERLAAVRDTHGGKSIFYYGGGGQGNHLPGAYATATRRALGSYFKSSALAQEKTGEFWVADRMIGAQTRGDFEGCDVAMSWERTRGTRTPSRALGSPSRSSPRIRRGPSSSSTRAGRKRPSWPTSTSRCGPGPTPGSFRRW